MPFWSITLRIVGAVYILWTIIDQPSTLPQSIVMAVICFAVAAGLDRLDQLDERSRQHSAALRRLLPSGRKSTTNDELAPHAPRGWVQFRPRPVDVEREKDPAYDQRLARRWRHIERPDKVSPVPQRPR